MQHEFHPVANIFPLMTDDELATLAADIAENGLHEAIWLDADGRIIDGRHRYLACEHIGIEPTYRTWDGEGSVVAFVVSLNLHRRHLDVGQRAMVAARLANLKHGSNRYEKVEFEISNSTATVDEAAALLNVSPATVVNARKVLHHGTPEEIAAVESGQASVSTIAEDIRRGAPPEQRGKNKPKKVRDRKSEKNKGKNPERIERMRIKAQVWAQVRDSLINLTSLPLPADAVALVRASDRTGLVDARLAKALNWLKDFSDEWSNRDEAQEQGSQERNGNADPGASGRAA